MLNHPFTLTGQVGFVTGAASGIGQAAATAMARSGAKVACADLPGADLGRTLEGIRAVGGTAIGVGCDVTKSADIEAAIRRTEADLGPLGLAVNSAGIANAAPALEMSESQWQHMYDVDCTGVFLSCQIEARAMLAAGGGSIVNIASMSGVIANRGLEQAHYNSAKAAVIHLSKSLAMELSSRGVRVNAVSPGYTATPMNRRPEVAEQAVSFATSTPLARMAEPDEVAWPAVFLLSRAASFVTGVNLLVDGGFCCW